MTTTCVSLLGELRLTHRCRQCVDSADVHHDAERTIVAIDRGTDTITLDVGVPIAIEERWGGGVLFKYREGR